MKYLYIGLFVALVNVASGVRVGVPIPHSPHHPGMRDTVETIEPHRLPLSETKRTPNNIRQHVITGTHYQVGVQLGQLIAPTLPTYLEQTNFTSTLETWLGKSAENKQLFAWWNELGKTKYPKYFAEIQGIADGAKQSLETILLLNYAFDIETIERIGAPSAVQSHCTDVLVYNTDMGGNFSLLLSHNEDGSTPSQLASVVALVTFTDDSEEVGYTGFHYPGQIVGNAWSGNAHGLSVSTNALFPKNTNKTQFAVPRCYLTRHVMAQASLADAKAILQSTPAVSGWNTNILDRNTVQLASIELYNSVTYETLLDSSTGKKVYYHMNNYRNLIGPHYPQWSDISSVHRLKTAESLPVAVNASTSLNILGDTSDSQYPIYRDGVPPDTGVVTLTTTQYFPHSTGQRNHGIVYDANPKTSSPVINFQYGDETP